MKHIILLGDSIFDNGRHVKGGPDVIQQLRAIVPQGWEATLLAVDGSVAADVKRQLEKLPASATHLVVSVGGNDGLASSGVLKQSCRDVASAMSLMSDIRDEFRNSYNSMLKSLVATGKPAAVCKVYEPNFQDRLIQRLTSTALTVFNDVIIREAFSQGLPLIDLRAVYAAPDAYANDIEPSIIGGARIAAAVFKLVQRHDSSLGQTCVYC